jgi:hydroxymethylglutaryl-CoA lyase
MGFGNPYGDDYSADVAIKWVGKLAELGIKTVAMSDTVGVATPDTIQYIFSNLNREFSGMNIGAHFHSTYDTWEEKIQSAYENGCMRFDSAMKGIGGCPMAKDELVGNIATEKLVSWCDKKGISTKIDKHAFEEAILMAANIFV